MPAASLPASKREAAGPKNLITTRKSRTPEVQYDDDLAEPFQIVVAGL